MLKNEKIIKIHPVPKRFVVTWMLGSRCNYDCMYCPAELHDKTSISLSLVEMQTAWKNIYNKTHKQGLEYKISFTGGELTANKNFLPLLEWLRTNYPEVVQIITTTNGSASLGYYKKLSQHVEGLSFSTHSEFFDEQKFFDKAVAVHQLMAANNKMLHVNIMNEYWNQDRILLYKEFLEKHKVNYSVNEIDYSKQVRTIYLKQGTYNLGTSS